MKLTSNLVKRKFVPLSHQSVFQECRINFMQGLVFLKKVRRILFLATTQRQPLRLTGVEARQVEGKDEIYFFPQPKRLW